MISRIWRLSLVLVSMVAFTEEARANHGFRQFGTSTQTILPGEGVEFILGGAQDPGAVDATMVFHLHLFFNEEAPTGLPQQRFSSGDVLRFTLGSTSVIYDFDHPSNIQSPPFYTFGFFDANGIDDMFGRGDPIGIGLAASDTNGQKMTLEVLAGDGVRFSGLEIADLAAGTFQKCGASTFVRKFNVDSGETVAINFDDLVQGDVVASQYHSRGVDFWGDSVYDEQLVIKKLGAGIDVIDGRFLVNTSTTPPLGRTRFLGLSFQKPVHALRFDYAASESELRVAGFDGPFAAGTFRFLDSFHPAPGPSGLLEGSASLLHPEGFDGVILAATKSILVDHLEITFRRIASIDFEGFSGDTKLYDQLRSLGVHFYGDGLANEKAVVDAYGVGYQHLHGNFLVNDDSTPPGGTNGSVGMSFDALVSKASFDFVGPSPLHVTLYRGALTPGNVVGTANFTTSTGTTGFLEGKVVVTVSGGFDGLVVDGSQDRVIIDNLRIEFSQP
jgi:hypothetical protein